jgi:tetratricopeptide (TPR) repeat protein
MTAHGAYDRLAFVYTRAIARYGDAYTYNSFRGEAYLRLKLFGQAIADFGKVVEMDKKSYKSNPDYLADRGRAFL